MPQPRTAAEIRDVNARYHDAAAGDYDSKWGITFGPVGRGQVLGKLGKALGASPGPYDRGLEIGAGTGYFTLNLMLAGVLRSAVCTDISPGMLRALRDNARELGLEVRTLTADAEQLPVGDEEFDLVFGHAVLHHLPDLDRAFSEFHRVLRPHGTLVFAGEPSRHGDRIAAWPKRAAAAAAPFWRALVRAPAARVQPHADPYPNGAGGDYGMEFGVDVHSFSPAELRRHAAAAGFEDVRIIGEELLASWFGWANRTLEGTADPDGVPWLWHQYAYRGYLLLQRIDRRLLEGRLPAQAFYNLMLAARRPPG
jgi:SAM-dependent methyltransferase